ncbi:hypothetical protein B0T16DRAFT_317884 [Cercophora newfieldiana]|uniref:Uncharacterized protein n=1 Tax=Cercophora newfieldiana TaxID=92897 RepID=A0AA39YQC4_9PEZI|nr:hypothetical protein B0T16DRAFT_317884 [Cercophora newfieldiana]
MASIASRPPPAVSPSAASTSASALSAPAIPTSVELTQENDPLIVRFTNVQDLFDAINCTIGDFLTVTNVSPSQFTEIEREREKRRRKFRFRRYDSKSRILIITIPTKLHEALHLGLYIRYDRQLVRNGREEDWTGIGSATFRAEQGHPGGDGGEGDSTGGPKPERQGIGEWPTLVIEAGDSESLGELQNDMRWWFRTSNHDVKIVILAKFDRRQHSILLEKWEEEISPPQGAITRSQAAAISQQNGVLEPVKRQLITITRDETTNPVSYNVTRGALVLGFRLLFLRDPGLQERDIVLSIQDLQRYAEDVWAVVPGLD